MEEKMQYILYLGVSDNKLSIIFNVEYPSVKLITLRNLIYKIVINKENKGLILLKTFNDDFSLKEIIGHNRL